MAKKINIIGAKPKRIQIVNKPRPRLDAAEIAEGLGAAPCSERIPGNLDLIGLAEIGTQLLARLRSSGGRPALTDAAEICRVPLSADDIKTLEQMVAQIESSSGARPSVGQLVSVIVLPWPHQVVRFQNIPGGLLIAWRLSSGNNDSREMNRCRPQLHSPLLSAV